MTDGLAVLGASVAMLLGALAFGVLVRWGTGFRGAERRPAVMELADLRGGPILAGQVSMAQLRRGGAVECGPLSTVVACGRPPEGSSALTMALYDALRRPQAWPLPLARPEVSAAIVSMRRRLIRRGWLLTDAQHRRIRLATVPLFAVAALGVAALVATAASRIAVRNVGALGGVVLVVGAALLAGWWLRYVPEIGLRGRWLLRRTRRTHRHLDPRRRPAWSTLSVDDLLLGMALFGPTPLRAVEPVFAELVGVHHTERSPFPSDITYPMNPGMMP